MKLEWDYPNPYIMELSVREKDIDIMGHTNNVVYLKWLEKVAWEHSNELGVDWKLYEKLGKALVARSHELDYLAPSFLNESLMVGTWVTGNDRRLSITRAYQIIRPVDAKTVFRGNTHWVCISLATGKPVRMPGVFVDCYRECLLPGD